MTSLAKMAVATAAFALLHSALASRPLKEAVASRVGREQSHAWYRAFFTAQSLLGFGLLVAYAGHLPRRTLYRIEGWRAWALRLGQAAGVTLTLAAARAAGIGRLSGLDNLLAWRGGRPILPGPAAQGPELDVDGKLRGGLPFHVSRHPLNLFPLLAIWCTPHLTDRRLGFNLVASVYLYLGSRHEEKRLLQEYGDRYRDYLKSGVPFYLPRWRRLGELVQARKAIRKWKDLDGWEQGRPS